MAHGEVGPRPAGEASQRRGPGENLPRLAERRSTPVPADALDPQPVHPRQPQRLGEITRRAGDLRSAALELANQWREEQHVG